MTVDEPFDRFRARFEHAVPRFDADRFAELARVDASWDEVRRVAAENAPHEFMIYWSLDASPLMRLAGGTRRCVEYLMGNHVIAERMYRHDPAALLYAPLRLAIYEGPPGKQAATDSHDEGARPVAARAETAGAETAEVETAGAETAEVETAGVETAGTRTAGTVIARARASAFSPEPATCLTIDQPSARFAGLGNPDITQVGLELDRKLADLLDHLHAPVPEAIAAMGGFGAG
ncbi:hypothetical protein [Pseudofrankia asymbiotica]|uniref:hypothetical protein n=1 Tax=Pseudofrankia asymbiotica TaxID=1834516 RepID=UPI0018EA1675|nr:hypothetical protein [Pseudofrankia asymbiotica]